ncbi:MAG: hypothetical protein Q9227_004428 [Pyrenula ochraceoflavens]
MKNYTSFGRPSEPDSKHVLLSTEASSSLQTVRPFNPSPPTESPNSFHSGRLSSNQAKARSPPSFNEARSGSEQASSTQNCVSSARTAVTKQTSNVSRSDQNIKTRPTPPKRKSSQSSAAKNDPPERKSGTKRSSASSASSGVIAGKKASSLAKERKGATLTSSEIPGSWQDVGSSSDSGGVSPVAEPKPAGWLVEKNFRGKFVDSQKQAATQINPPGQGKNASVRFLDQLPLRADVKGNEKQARAGQAEAPTSAPGSAIATTQNQVNAFKGGVDHTSSEAMLPRTKSQLSMMVERERRASNLGPAQPSRSQLNLLTNTATTTRDSAEEDDEEEGIVMGMGVGKTQVKKRGKRSDKRRYEESSNYYSPPPGPIW